MRKQRHDGNQWGSWEAIELHAIPGAEYPSSKPTVNPSPEVETRGLGPSCMMQVHHRVVTVSLQRAA
jgi:hypothetical protein